MAAVKDIALIVTNPSLSGQALKAMILVGASDGTFGVQPEFPAVALGDGQTTIVRIPVGGRLVICEASDHSNPSVMKDHPDVTGKPAVAFGAIRPMDDQEAARRPESAGRPMTAEEADRHHGDPSHDARPGHDSVAGWQDGMSHDEEAQRRSDPNFPGVAHPAATAYPDAPDAPPAAVGRMNPAGEAARGRMDPSLPAGAHPDAMGRHDVAGHPAGAPGQAPYDSGAGSYPDTGKATGPASVDDEARRVAATQSPRVDAVNAELAAQQGRGPSPVTVGQPSPPAAAGRRVAAERAMPRSPVEKAEHDSGLTFQEDARRNALAGQATRTPAEQAEHDALQARQR